MHSGKDDLNLDDLNLDKGVITQVMLLDCWTVDIASVAQPGQSECLVSTRSRVQIPPEALNTLAYK